MKKIKQRNGKLPLLLITAILTLCAGFLIVGCGTDPVLKATDVDKGAYAVDFNACPGDYCYGTAGTTDNPMVDIGNKEITFEALVKKNTVTAVTGAVFSRLDTASGAVLYVKADEPSFAMRANYTASSSADYIVSAGAASNLVQGAWTHIAGVIANADHSLVHSSVTCLKGDGSAGGESEKPHLDIYVNGQIQNCGTTWDSTNSDTTNEPQFADNSGSDKAFIGKIEDSTDADCVDPATDPKCNTLDNTIYQTTNLNAVVDELRLWTTARTATQLSECYNKELGFSGNCSRADSNLAVYFRMNEGTANLTTDWSGNGYLGSFFYMTGTDESSWDAAWVAGNGVTGAD